MLKAQGVSDPETTEGCAAACSGVAVTVRAVPVPQPFDGVTLMVPAVDEGTTEMLLVP